MVFSPKNKYEINLSVIEREYVISINNKLARKKYISGFSVLLTFIVATISRLPTMVKIRRKII